MADSVTQFHELTEQLISEALTYARGGVFIEETNRNINALRADTNVLLAALQQAQIPRPWNPPGATGPSA